MGKYYVALAPKRLWVDPIAIGFKIQGPTARAIDAGSVVPIDWDRQLIHIDHSVKHRSLRMHFQEGVPWEETPLFSSVYRRRLSWGHVIRGETSLSALAHRYAAEVDALYSSMERYGYQLSTNEVADPRAGPQGFISRKGEMLFGRQGNHRLAIARLLQIDRFPITAVAEHTFTETRIS